ncbi:hypothetical protein FRC02_009423 [Tulasnella sp. 418]|nr:hypothetical protein FRC02_009423 [Tulasnella sp. 418]
MHSHSHGESDNYTCIGPLSSILTHFRYLTTLRSSSRTAEYHSIVIFRLSAPSDASLLVYAMESTCPHLGADMSHADIEESGLDVVAVCPWHRYDFNLKTGQSETGLKACTFDVQIRPSGDEKQQSYVWIENPGAGTWEIVEIRPVSEEFADPPDLSKLTINEAKSDLTGPTTLTSDHNQEPNSLLEFAILVLNTADPEQKVEKTRQAVAAFRTGKIKSVGRNTTLRPPDVPPRHDLRLVAPGKVTKRGKAGSVKSRIAILHALANIEQWAIDLAYGEHFLISRLTAQLTTRIWN